MKGKTILAGLTIIFTGTAVLLSGCGSGTENGNAGATEGTSADTEATEGASVSGEEYPEGIDLNALNYSGTVKIWVSDDVTGFTQDQVEAFAAQYPGLSGTSFTIEAVNENEAASRMLADVENGADLYAFTQDQTARLAAAGALQEVPAAYASDVGTENDEGAVAAATVGNVLYAYPITSDNGYLLYYDSNIVTDPSSLGGILSDCEAAGKKFCMEINSGWYQPAFFFGTGCVLSYKTDENGNFVSANISYASDKGVVALKEMISLHASSAFSNTSSPAEEAEIGAIVDGIWDADVMKAKFGAGYACAKLPSFEGADGRDYQLSGFSGYKLLGVKPGDDMEKVAICEALAAWLSGEDVQLARYQTAGWGPSNLAAQKSSDVRSNEALAALYEQMSYDRPQGAYPGDYWTLAASLGDDVITGTLTESSSDDTLMEALQTFQDACISYAEE